MPEKGLVQVDTQMIGIKSWVNKDYIIQFVLNPENLKFQISKFNISKMSFFLAETLH